MNYIQHLSGFFNKLSSDNRPNPTHVSLYLALFQIWNTNMFENPISISRSCTLRLSKIGSAQTYHKCITDLSSWGYISYQPSHNPLKGSLVYMYSFVTTPVQVEPTTCTGSEQVSNNHLFESGSSSGEALYSYTNSINIKNNKTNSERKKNAQNFKKNKKSDFSKNNPKNDFSVSRKRKRKKVAPKKEKVFAAPTLDEVIVFFSQQAYPELEARKFFYHFQANGWKVGGKAPMKDWHAASHNWMLNEKNFNSPSKTKTNNTITVNTDKAYDIPL